MQDLVLKVFVIGDLANNCYLIFDKNTKKGFIVDIPAPVKEIQGIIQKEKLDIQFIVLTHAHFDHMAGMKSFALPFYLHPADAPLLRDTNLNLSSFLECPFTIEKEYLPLEENQAVPFDSYSLEVIHTPGHTPGSVSLKLGKWVFSGDALFFDSIGRTDLPLASSELLIKSIRKGIFTLNNDVIVYPGHGPSTTVGREKKHNPFLSG